MPSLYRGQGVVGVDADEPRPDEGRVRSQAPLDDEVGVDGTRTSSPMAALAGLARRVVSRSSGWDGAAGDDGLARYTDNRNGRYSRMEARQHGIAPVEGSSSASASRPTTRATMARRDARPRRKSRQSSRELEPPSRVAVRAADGGCSDFVLEAKSGVGAGVGHANGQRPPPHVSTHAKAGGLRGRDER